jgi:hypothetical protein
MGTTPSCSLLDFTWARYDIIPYYLLRFPTNEGGNIVPYIVGSHRVEGADQFLAWEASRVPSSARLPHNFYRTAPLPRTIRYINGIIAEVPECDVIHIIESRWSEMASSYLFRRPLPG